MLIRRAFLKLLPFLAGSAAGTAIVAKEQPEPNIPCNKLDADVYTQIPPPPEDGEDHILAWNNGWKWMDVQSLD